MRRWRNEYGWLLLLLAAFMGVALCCKNDVTGVIYDDGVYLMGAKALANGLGYRLLADPHQPGIVLYPPLFSTVLAPLWWLQQSPSVVIAWAKTANVGLAALGLAGCYWLARNIYALSTGLSALLVSVVAANFYTLVYATNIMSEPLYLLLSVLALGYAATLNRSARVHISGKQVFYLVLLSAGLFYTRTLGVVFVAATATWLAIRFSPKTGLCYGFFALLCCLPWLLWVQHQPATLYTLGHYWVVPYNQSYLTHLWLALNTTHTPLLLVSQGVTAFLMAFQEILIPRDAVLATLSLFIKDSSGPPAQNLSLGSISLNSVSLTLGTVLFVLLQMPLMPYWQKLSLAFNKNPWHQAIQSVGVSPVALYVTLYLVTLPCWYDTHQLTRFLLMVLPFGLMMVFGALQRAPNLSASVVERTLKLACVGLITLQVATYPKLYSLSQNQLLYHHNLPIWQEYQAAMAYIKQHVSRHDVVWCWQSMVFPVYADARFINYNIFPDAETYQKQGFTVDDRFVSQVLFQVFRREKVRYVLSVPAFNQGRLMGLVDPHTVAIKRAAHETLLPVYRSPRGLVSLYRWQAPAPER